VVSRIKEKDLAPSVTEPPVAVAPACGLRERIESRACPEDYGEVDIDTGLNNGSSDDPARFWRVGLLSALDLGDYC